MLEKIINFIIIKVTIKMEQKKTVILILSVIAFCAIFCVVFTNRRKVSNSDTYKQQLDTKESQDTTLDYSAIDKRVEEYYNIGKTEETENITKNNPNRIDIGEWYDNQNKENIKMYEEGGKIYFVRMGMVYSCVKRKLKKSLLCENYQRMPFYLPKGTTIYECKNVEESGDLNGEAYYSNFIIYRNDKDVLFVFMNDYDPKIYGVINIAGRIN